MPSERLTGVRPRASRLTSCSTLSLVASARRSMACHASQFEAEQRGLISELFHSDCTRYFRRYSGGTTVSTSLFEEPPG